MTEADLYPHLAHLAGGQVYPYVVPLLDGRPSVALPWVVFSLISSVSADVMGGQAESSVSVQIDVYAGTVTQARQIRQDAREAIMLLAPGPSVKCRTIFRKTAVTVQPWSFRSRCDFSFFLQNPYPPRAGFLLSGGRMSALYERSQLTQVMISSAPATAETMDKAEYLRLDCTIKEVQFTAGQKQDIDVTTLCSTEQENINGLGASSEISMSGNFYLNQAQNALRDAYDNDTVYAFKVQFPSGKGFKFLAEVRQHTWSSGTNGVVAATFSLRLKGKPVSYVVPLAFVKNPRRHLP
ncbi:major tail subunit encoded within prophage CP-933V [Escherichia coli]|uniref:Major tail subunit encoded within prophage CP-933V n=29 Tax=Enterobacterales TaxID=91347 RepID=A0A377D0R5_ECOLX|nr:major tail subunit encoded within prophage CP-933V [Escherichia coli]